MTDKSTNQTQTKRWSNMSPSEKQVDKNLRGKPYVYLPSDKGSEYCFCDQESYTEEAYLWASKVKGTQLPRSYIKTNGWHTVSWTHLHKTFQTRTNRSNLRTNTSNSRTNNSNLRVKKSKYTKTNWFVITTLTTGQISMIVYKGYQGLIFARF